MHSYVKHFDVTINTALISDNIEPLNTSVKFYGYFYEY